MPTALVPLLAIVLLALLPASGWTAPAPPFPELFPDATRYESEAGPPPVTAAYRGDELLGWAFSTHEAVGSVGYSGRELDLLIGLDTEGRLTGTKLVSEEEPIFFAERMRRELDRLLADYRGRSVAEAIEVRREGGEGAIQAVSGATVSSLVINDTVLGAARTVANAKGLFGGSSGLKPGGFAPATWRELVADGSIVARRFTLGDLAARLEEQNLRPEIEGGDPQSLFVELFTALATPARIGRNLAGTREFAGISGSLGVGDQLVFIGARGRYSFKGTSWVKTGTFERIELVQGERTIRFTQDDHIRLDELAIEGPPSLRETALFVVRDEQGLQPAEPWRLRLLVPANDPGGEGAYGILELGYELPTSYISPPAPEARTGPAWQGVWLARLGDLGVLGAGLTILTGILFFQDQLARHPRIWSRLRLAFLTFTLVWIGWYATAQLSVVNVLTFGNALRAGFSWDFFLLEPLIFVLWCYVAVGLVFWGRGTFCGWLCPFGAMQELSNHAAQRLGVRQLAIPFWLHERLRTVKFVIFLALVGVALGSMGDAMRVAEVEPFKTAIVLHFLREIPFVAYAAALLVAGLFVERFFCRYLCPLGAALALPARLRQFEWLKRHWQCGRECRICQVQCPVQAIQPEGNIHPGECIYCLKCQCNYYNDRVCPPMIERRKRAERRAELAARTAASRTG